MSKIPQEAIELLPCPFCGEQAERIDIDDGDNAGGSFICCTACQASGNIEFGYKENFVSNWNRRADAARAQGAEVAVKRLEWLSEDNGDSVAQSVVGWYHVGLPASYWSCTTPDGRVEGGFESHVDAEIFAQADYEQRIRSALATPPAPQPTDREKVLEEAITEAIDLLMCRKLGSPARSPEHNARLKLQAALAGGEA